MGVSSRQATPMKINPESRAYAETHFLGTSEFEALTEAMPLGISKALSKVLRDGPAS